MKPVSTACLLAITCTLLLPSAALAQPAAGVSLGGKSLPMDFQPAKQIDGGVEITLDLSDKRVNWNHAKWSVCRFEKPLDLSAYNALLLQVEIDKPREDVGVYVALQEADGTWRHHPWAAPLVGKTNTGLARFEHFVRPAWVAPPGGSQGDENETLDVQSIQAVAIGSVNPLGVGPVTFRLKGLRAVRLPEKPSPSPKVTLSGAWLDVNGTEMIPAGAFGGFHGPKGQKLRLSLNRTIMSNFATGGDARFSDDPIRHTMINCAGERIWPSPVLHDPQWKAKTVALAAKMARQANDRKRELWVEFWNEPYLNWAKAERGNFIPRFYNLDEAAEGAPVKLKHSGEVVPHLFWTKNYKRPPWNWCSQKDWRRGMDEDGNLYSPAHAKPYHGGVRGLYGGWWDPSVHPPLDVKDGEKYTVQRGGKTLELTATTPWHVYDETQFTYWAGKGMTKFYIDQMQAFGPELKRVKPDAIFYAGWGLRPSEDKWACFNALYKPTIDAGIEYIDGLHGHDYGGGPLAELACIETVTAYGMLRHEKWLTWINTEMSGLIDTQAYPEATRQKQTTQDKAAWLYRKILNSLYYQPAKVRGLCQFYYDEQAEGQAFILLSNLRGKMLHVDCDDPEIIAVASVDGTDPANPRPDFLPDRKELVLAILNESQSVKQVPISPAPPAGLKLGEPIVRQIAVEDGKTTVAESKPGKLESVEIQPRRAVTITWPVTGKTDGGKTVKRRQFFIDAVVRTVTAEKPVEDVVEIDPEVLQSAGRAWVRIAVENLEPAEAQVIVGDKTYALPAAVTPDNAAWIRQIPIDPKLLTARTPVRIELTGKDRAGFLLASASILVESE
ncbi:MAG: hypothetical protein ACLFUJ_14000 [Phycisphaerae bacterium]